MPKDKECRAFVTGLGSNVPPYRFSQDEIGQFMKRYMVLDETARRWTDFLVKQSKIDYRYSVLPDYACLPDEFAFYPQNDALEPFPGVGDRMRHYRQSAPDLAVGAAKEALEDAGLAASQITHLITVSCTGMYAPGIDIDLVGYLGLPSHTARTCINFMGCYGAFNALKVAASITSADSRAKVLIVCVELCSLHFQKQGLENSQLLSNMLFGDGASAVVMESVPAPGRIALGLINFAADLFPEGRDEMTWEISDFGFAMKLTSGVSDVLKKGVKPVFERLLSSIGRAIPEVEHYAFHPGGPKVLEVLEEACGITSYDTRWSYDVLRAYGNMSSATIFFILQKIVRSRPGDGQLVLSAAFGPGLTCESALWKVVG